MRIGIAYQQKWKIYPGKICRKYYDAVTAGIDFTARDIQNQLKAKGLPWEKAKAWDNSAVLANGFLWQTSKIKRILISVSIRIKNLFSRAMQIMIHNFDQIVSYISNFFLSISVMLFLPGLRPEWAK